MYRAADEPAESVAFLEFLNFPSSVVIAHGGVMICGNRAHAEEQKIWNYRISFPVDGISHMERTACRAPVVVSHCSRSEQQHKSCGQPNATKQYGHRRQLVTYAPIAEPKRKCNCHSDAEDQSLIRATVSHDCETESEENRITEARRASLAG